jgi:hypothetical protein
MAPQRCAYGVCLFFWKSQRLICVIAIMRKATQGDLSPAEMNLIRQLYPQFLTALCRLRSLEREHSLRMDLEDFLSRLPLPTILLRWNLKPIYQNRAARDFCALWEKGPEEAQLMKATSPIPSAQTTMGARATPYRAANGLQRRTGAPSMVAAFASDRPVETARFSRRGAAAFSYRVRGFAPSRYSIHGVGSERPFAASCPTHQARTGSSATCLRRAEQPGDRRKRPVECANGEKASSRGLPQTRSPQPQPAYDADALITQQRLTPLASCVKIAIEHLISEIVPVVQRIERRFPKSICFPSHGGSKLS